MSWQDRLRDLGERLVAGEITTAQYRTDSEEILAELGIPSGSRLSFAYGGITRYADAFQRLRLPKRFVTPCRISSSG
jgi:hypothetical protein